MIMAQFIFNKEEEMTYPFLDLGNGEITALTVKKGHVIESVINPDPVRFDSVKVKTSAVKPEETPPV
jgi:hypothetical protein